MYLNLKFHSNRFSCYVMYKSCLYSVSFSDIIYVAGSYNEQDKFDFEFEAGVAVMNCTRFVSTLSIFAVLGIG